MNLWNTLGAELMLHSKAMLQVWPVGEPGRTG